MSVTAPHIGTGALGLRPVDTFEGRRAVITGGANGIGLATAREFARRGAHVVLGDIAGPALDDAVSTLRAEGHVAHGVICDVTRLEDVEQLADETERLIGPADIVFNNAGVALAGPITEMSHADWRWLIDIDLWGPIHGVEVFVPRLQRSGGGHILFTASFAGLVANVGLGPYCVAKYGVVALAEVLSRELKPDGIGVSVLCPMLVGTNLENNSQRSRAGLAADVVADDHTDPPFVGHVTDDVVLDVNEVARLTVDAVASNRLYVVPHSNARGSIRRRFERIDRTFDDQAADGWAH